MVRIPEWTSLFVAKVYRCHVTAHRSAQKNSMTFVDICTYTTQTQTQTQT